MVTSSISSCPSLYQYHSLSMVIGGGVLVLRLNASNKRQKKHKRPIFIRPWVVFANLRLDEKKPFVFRAFRNLEALMTSFYFLIMS